MTIKTLHIDPVSHSLVLRLLMTSQAIADDVTMIRQLWREHVKIDI